MMTDKLMTYKIVNRHTPSCLSDLHKPRALWSQNTGLLSVPRVRENQLAAGPSIMPYSSGITSMLTSDSLTLLRSLKSKVQLIFAP